MSTNVYNVLPMLLEDGARQHHFVLKVNASTQSFRLESKSVKRSVFIGKKAFNSLFQLFRNEYGILLGQVFYDNTQMKKGTATTADNTHFRFTVEQLKDIKVVLENENSPSERVTATVSDHSSSDVDEIVRKAIIPSVLSALIFAKEAGVIA